MTNNKFCKFCGAPIPEESRFCLKCGAMLTGTPQQRNEHAVTQEPYAPSYPPPAQEPKGGLGASFWLGFVGGVFGILGGVVALFVGSLNEAYTGAGGDFYGLGIAAMIFSVVGIVGGALERRKKVGGTLMIISAIGILISISYFGVLSFILFLIGGILMFARDRRP